VVACLEGLPPALAAFEARFVAPLGPGLRRFEASDDFVAEVLQRLRTKLLVGEAPALAAYGASGPLFAWLKVVASRVALDRLREMRPARKDEAGDDVIANGIARTALGPEAELLRSSYGTEFKQAFAEVMASLSTRDRALLRRHLVERLTLEEIARPYNVHPATIARRLESLRGEIARQVRARIGSEASFAALAKVIRSDVDLSLTGLAASRSVTLEAPSTSASGG
ncbi:MAG TPA: sigma-70 family RNA polymerase sigma factor, partial [Polyangia bacterium]